MPKMPTAVPGMDSNVEFLWNKHTSLVQHIDKVAHEAVAGEDELVLYDGSLRVVRGTEAADLRIPAAALRFKLCAALTSR